MSYSSAWQNKEHSRQFGKAIRKKSLLLFSGKFNRYIPARCLNYLINSSTAEKTSILDVGCAGGDFYAYLSCVGSSIAWDYKGLDISEPAINIARNHYGNHLFDLIESNDNLEKKKADIVLSIDVLIHQVRPYEHLKSLINCAGKYLLIALRTRDIGDTVFDPELSCQRNYGKWVPFIIFNSNKLYSKIFELSNKPLKITCFKEYQILGGERRRFLPKDLYTEEPKSAISTLLIEICDADSDGKITEHIYKTRKEFKKFFGFDFLSNLSQKKLIGNIILEKYSEKIITIEDLLKYSEVTDKKVIDFIKEKLY